MTEVPTIDGLREKLKGTQSGLWGLYSITRANIAALVAAILIIAGERGFVGNDLTSEDCRAVFQGKTWTTTGWSKEGMETLKFHPIEKFPHLYSSEMPERIASYTWFKFTLRGNLGQFLDQLEALHPPNVDGTTSYWLDILFSDQNSKQMALNLEIADHYYHLTKFHFACVCRGMLSRIWVIHELIVRLKSVIILFRLMEGGKSLTDAIIEVGKRIMNGDPSCTIFVTVQSLTNLDEDIGWDKTNRLGDAKASVASDKDAITDKTKQSIGIEAANFAIKLLADAAITNYANRRPVCLPAQTRSQGLDMWAASGR